MTDGQLMRGTIADDQDAFNEAAQKVAHSALKKVQKAAAADRVTCDSISVTASQPWEGILKAVKQKKCDMIVMASHGRGVIAGMLLGSVTAKILSSSKTPVLVCR
jgi:nucleotide-binding universal stress UspA family protein